MSHSEAAMTQHGGPTAAAAAWRAAMPLFDRWIESDARVRAALLEDVAGRDPAVHARLLELIAADAAAERRHFLAGDALHDPVWQGDAAGTSAQLAGERLGPWRLQQTLGEGGSGQVWLAQRCDGLHDGVAALKLLRAAAVDSNAQRRFAREAHVLARLRHAHIARLFDVGDTVVCGRGQRYLVLEYVDGERIDRWCDERNATIETRLRLFLQICEAVSYAHANLIVHRDLKPSNILVQADGAVKLLDFGVAKLLAGDEDTDGNAELTRGGVAPFTPEYAAPEQFEGRAVTVATDVYSLGVVLHLLLAGHRPHGGGAALRPPAHVAADARPVRLAHALDGAEDADAVARLRGTTQAQLRRALRGDLDTILGQALRKNPADRYASVQALADDLRRWLERKPILARADSLAYRARLFVARHRGGVALGLAAALALLVGGGMLALQDRRLRVEVERANAIKQFLIDSISNVDPYFANGRPTLDSVALLERAAGNIDRELPADDATRAEVYDRFGIIMVRFAQFEQAEKLWRQAAQAYHGVDGERSLRAFRAEAFANSAVLDQGDFARAQAQTEALLARIDALAGWKDAREARYAALMMMAYTASQVGNSPLAREWAQRVAAAARLDVEGERDYYVSARRRLAIVALESGDLREAAPRLRELAALGRTLYPSDAARLTNYLHYLVAALCGQGNHAEAKSAADAALELLHRKGLEREAQIVQITADRAAANAGLGADADAERDFAAAAAYADDLFKYKPYDRAQLDLRLDYGVFLAQRGRFGEALAQFGVCRRVVSEVPNDWHDGRAACAAGAAYGAAHLGHGEQRIAELDGLIGELRAHAARDLPLALWLRERLAQDGIARSVPAQRLAWLDEAESLLDGSGRSGSRLARDVEAARSALGAPPFALRRESGDGLVEAAAAIIAAVQ